VEQVMRKKSLLGAVNLCIELSGLEDKEIYMDLAIDAGHFSNLRKGKGHFPTDKIEQLMDMCGNEAPLIWLATRRGYALMLVKSEAERRAEELATELKQERQRRQWAESILAGRATS